MQSSVSTSESVLRRRALRGLSFDPRVQPFDVQEGVSKQDLEEVDRRRNDDCSCSRRRSDSQRSR